MFGYVVLAGFFSMMRRQGVMAMGEVGVMTRFLVVAGFVLVSGRVMMLCRVFVMFSRLAMVVCCFFRHYVVS
ncbi:MAG TPA: hypothetical protein VKG25_05100 [Bryobacteraceae bacterium]|nr:hypothetical protein [Bryobacteraceae bacterium]